MKNLIAIALALCSVVVALACSSSDPEVDGVTGATEQTGGRGDGAANGKMLVVYFSRAGGNKGQLDSQRTEVHPQRSTLQRPARHLYPEQQEVYQISIEQ